VTQYRHCGKQCGKSLPVRRQAAFNINVKTDIRL